MEPTNVCCICYEPETAAQRFMDVNPCACKGSIQFHNACLRTMHKKCDAKVCSICKSRYEIPDGHMAWYYPDGTVSEVGSYKNGRYNGLWKWYYPDGNVSAIERYIEGGVRHGSSTYYYADGNIKSCEMYENGEKHGRFVFYHPNGNLRCKETYVHGKLHGIVTFYHENEAMHCENMYEHGKCLFTRMHFVPAAAT